MTITATETGQQSGAPLIAKTQQLKRFPIMVVPEPANVQEIKEALNFNVRKTKALKSVGMPNMRSLEEQRKYIVQGNQQAEPGQRLSIPFFSNELMTVIQNGYRTKKEYQTADPDEEPKPLKISNVPKSFGTPITAEDFNAEKMTFRSGYQALGKEDQQAEYDLLLKGVEFPLKITGQKMYGSQNGANGYNGLQKSNLYLATYLDPDGVGNRPK